MSGISGYSKQNTVEKSSVSIVENFLINSKTTKIWTESNTLFSDNSKTQEQSIK